MRQVLVAAAAASWTAAVCWWVTVRQRERARGARRGRRTGSVSVRRALPADRAELAQLVVSNHLSLSAECPGEWLEQLRDVPDDFAHLLDAARSACGMPEHATMTASRRRRGRYTCQHACLRACACPLAAA